MDQHGERQAPDGAPGNPPRAPRDGRRRHPADTPLARPAGKRATLAGLLVTLGIVFIVCGVILLVIVHPVAVRKAFVLLDATSSMLGQPQQQTKENSIALAEKLLENQVLSSADSATHLVCYHVRPDFDESACILPSMNHTLEFPSTAPPVDPGEEDQGSDYYGACRFFGKALAREPKETGKWLIVVGDLFHQPSKGRGQKLMLGDGTGGSDSTDTAETVWYRGVNVVLVLCQQPNIDSDSVERTWRAYFADRGAPQVDIAYLTAVAGGRPLLPHRDVELPARLRLLAKLLIVVGVIVLIVGVGIFGVST